MLTRVGGARDGQLLNVMVVICGGEVRGGGGMGYGGWERWRSLFR